MIFPFFTGHPPANPFLIATQWAAEKKSRTSGFCEPQGILDFFVAANYHLQSERDGRSFFCFSGSPWGRTGWQNIQNCIGWAGGHHSRLQARQAVTDDGQEWIPVPGRWLKQTCGLPDYSLSRMQHKSLFGDDRFTLLKPQYGFAEWNLCWRP